jgi:hypothetical protein
MVLCIFQLAAMIGLRTLVTPDRVDEAAARLLAACAVQTSSRT